MHLFNILFFRFVRAFRERVSPEQRPIVVHCSAGVGRSGTMIAIDRILQGIRKYDVVDIFGIVYEMRKERVWMVQTEQQYICIHQVSFLYTQSLTVNCFPCCSSEHPSSCNNVDVCLFLFISDN